MKIFNHEGCHSGQCVWKEHGMACLIARELSCDGNHIKERRHSDDLLNEAGRLLDEQHLVGRDSGYQERIRNTDPLEFREVQ